MVGTGPIRKRSGFTAFVRRVGRRDGKCYVQFWTDEPWPWHQAGLVCDTRPTDDELRDMLLEFVNDLEAKQ